MPKSKNRGKTYIPGKNLQQSQRPTSNQPQINLLVWGACPYVITGFGVIMRQMLSNLFRQYPGIYNIFQVSINFHGDYCDEFEITGKLENGRYRQWPAVVNLPGGQVNLFGHTKFLELIRGLHDVDIDAVFLFEDPFQVGGGVPGVNQDIAFIDAVRGELAAKGMSHVPIVSYFPIDGIPHPKWLSNLAKCDIPITYLNFGAEYCLKGNLAFNGKIGVIPHGVNFKEFFPVSDQESRSFKRAMFGEAFANKYMVLNVNRNQLRKLIPSNLLAFKEFQKLVPNSFMYLNMRPVDVGWNLIECCNSCGLVIGRDVMFLNDFNIQRGLPIEDLNMLFNCADVLTTTATGGGWELALTQAFATKTLVVAPDNTSHSELCGDQTSLDTMRGVLYRSGSNLAQCMIFPQDNEVIRPLPDLDDMVVKMKAAYDNKEMSDKIIDNAYRWVHESLSWDKHVVPKFHAAFTKAKQMKLERKGIK